MLATYYLGYLILNSSDIIGLTVCSILNFKHYATLASITYSFTGILANLVLSCISKLKIGPYSTFSSLLGSVSSYFNCSKITEFFLSVVDSLIFPA